ACIQYFNAIISAYQPPLPEGWGGVTVQSPRLLFIVGMPRSGTSLVEQMLDSHPEVQAAGELPLITQFVESLPSILNTTHPYPECVAEVNREVVEGFARQYLDQVAGLSGGKRYVVDKMPGNFRFLGLIQAMFPESRVIHCRRDPLDTCLSCYFHEFNASQNYSTELDDLGLFYQGYRKLMEHWGRVLSLPVFDLQYEALVRGTEEVCQNLLRFCGLEWDQRCLQFFDNRRDVGTASHEQVRKPIYAHSAGRWKSYRKHLEPLKAALARPWPAG
ncbi:MAG TPA: sulfotransferase, partial [Gammaproteobacteria bacterium]|nr:sulfotransferase [Gammaproteobacteria bacterium]